MEARRKIYSALAAAGVALTSFATPCVAQEGSTTEASPPWVLTLSTNYGDWKADKLGNAGSKGVGFAQLGYTGREYGGAVTTRYVRTDYLTAQSPDRFSISTTADVELSDYYTCESGSMALRGGVDLTIPTGKGAYSTDELTRILSDPLGSDLMSVNLYNQGLNVSPHFLVANTFSKSMSMGIGAKYTFTGEYTPTTDVEGDRYKPGSRLMVIGNGAYGFTEADFLAVNLIYYTVGRDTRNGEDVYRTGDLFSADIKYLKSWNENLMSMFALIVMTQRSNEYMNAELALEAESRNSNNNSVEVVAYGGYKLTGEITLSGVAGYKNVAANAYEPGDAFYDAGRWKAYLEPGVIWNAAHGMQLAGKIRYTRIMDKKDAFEAEDNTYSLLNADISLVYNFGL